MNTDTHFTVPPRLKRLSRRRHGSKGVHCAGHAQGWTYHSVWSDKDRLPSTVRFNPQIQLTHL